jgi:hypothetical protein
MAADQSPIVSVDCPTNPFRETILRLLGENTVAAATEEIPGVDVVLTGIAIKDDLALLQELSAEVRDSEAAMTAVNRGPQDLEALLSPKASRDFETYDALKKRDITKYISPADEGEEIHHIVEQSQIGGDITNRMVQSTDNVIKIPRLLHEEINSIYATRRSLGGGMVSPREYLKGRPFDEQRSFGLDTLREVGIVR